MPKKRNPSFPCCSSSSMFSAVTSVFSIVYGVSCGQMRQMSVPYHCDSRPINRSPAPKNSSLINLTWSYVLPSAWSRDNVRWESRWCCFPGGTWMKTDCLLGFRRRMKWKDVFRLCKKKKRTSRIRMERVSQVSLGKTLSLSHLYRVHALTQTHNKRSKIKNKCLSQRITLLKHWFSLGNEC